MDSTEPGPWKVLETCLCGLGRIQDTRRASSDYCLAEFSILIHLLLTTTSQEIDIVIIFLLEGRLT